LQSLGLVDVPDGGDLSPTTSCDEADVKYVHSFFRSNIKLHFSVLPGDNLNDNLFWQSLAAVILVTAAAAD